jgi:uncharacterized protein YndB with AHSA1/START domain
MKPAILLALALASPATAALTSSAPDGFVSRHEASVAVPPAKAWAALTAWQRWWSPAHTYSGTAPVLSLKAGGGLIESWPGGEVLHATVMNALPPKLLRLQGGFGPLQALPVNAVLDFVLAPEGDGTKITMVYRVSGNAAAKLDTLAAPVDAVMAEGFARLTRFAATGKAE